MLGSYSLLLLVYELPSLMSENEKKKEMHWNQKIKPTAKRKVK